MYWENNILNKIYKSKEFKYFKHLNEREDKKNVIQTFSEMIDYYKLENIHVSTNGALFKRINPLKVEYFDYHINYNCFSFYSHMNHIKSTHMNYFTESNDYYKNLYQTTDLNTFYYEFEKEILILMLSENCQKIKETENFLNKISKYFNERQNYLQENKTKLLKSDDIKDTEIVNKNSHKTQNNNEIFQMILGNKISCFDIYIISHLFYIDEFWDFYFSNDDNHKNKNNNIYTWIKSFSFQLSLDFNKIKKNQINDHQRLLERTAELNLSSELNDAVKTRDLNLIESLLIKGHNPNSLNSIKRHLKTIVHFAAESGNIELFKLLLKYNCDIYIKDHENMTCIFYAVESGSTEMLDYLIDELKMDINQYDIQNRSLFYWASCLGDIPMIKYLINRGAKVTTNSVMGRSAFSKACWNGRFDIIKLLLETPGLNIDINERDGNGRVALHNSCWGEFGGRLGKKMSGVSNTDSPETTEMLLLYGAEKDLEDNAGYTPLMIAATTSGLESLKYLIAFGADINHKNSMENTALTECCKYGMFESLDILLNYSDKNAVILNNSGSNNFSVLDYCVIQDNLHSLKMVLDYNNQLKKDSSSNILLTKYYINDNLNCYLKLLIYAGIYNSQLCYEYIIEMIINNYSKSKNINKYLNNLLQIHCYLCNFQIIVIFFKVIEKLLLSSFFKFELETTTLNIFMLMYNNENVKLIRSTEYEIKKKFVLHEEKEKLEKGMEVEFNNFNSLIFESKLFDKNCDYNIELDAYMVFYFYYIQSENNLDKSFHILNETLFKILLLNKKIKLIQKSLVLLDNCNNVVKFSSFINNKNNSEITIENDDLNSVKIKLKPNIEKFDFDLEIMSNIMNNNLDNDLNNIDNNNIIKNTNLNNNGISYPYFDKQLKISMNISLTDALNKIKSEYNSFSLVSLILNQNETLEEIEILIFKFGLEKIIFEFDSSNYDNIFHVVFEKNCSKNLKLVFELFKKNYEKIFKIYNISTSSNEEINYNLKRIILYLLQSENLEGITPFDNSIKKQNYSFISECLDLVNSEFKISENIANKNLDYENQGKYFSLILFTDSNINFKILNFDPKIQEASIDTSEVYYNYLKESFKKLKSVLKLVQHSGFKEPPTNIFTHFLKNEKNSLFDLDNEEFCNRATFIFDKIRNNELHKEFNLDFVYDYDYQKNNFFDINNSSLKQKVPYYNNVIIESEDDLSKIMAEFSNENVLGVDMEFCKIKSKQIGVVCLMQISSFTKSIIIDCLKLSKVINKYCKEIFEDNNIVKVFHGFDNDLTYLITNFNIFPRNIFDTAKAYLVFEKYILNNKKFNVLQCPSLGYLNRHLLKVEVDKSFQKADWRLRPLTKSKQFLLIIDMLQYAVNDAKSVVYIFYFFGCLFNHMSNFDKNFKFNENSKINKLTQEFIHQFIEKMRLGILNNKESNKNLKTFSYPNDCSLKLILVETYMTIFEYLKLNIKEKYDSISFTIQA